MSLDAAYADSARIARNRRLGIHPDRSLLCSRCERELDGEDCIETPSFSSDDWGLFCRNTECLGYGCWASRAEVIDGLRTHGALGLLHWDKMSKPMKITLHSSKKVAEQMEAYVAEVAEFIREACKHNLGAGAAELNVTRTIEVPFPVGNYPNLRLMEEHATTIISTPVTAKKVYDAVVTYYGVEDISHLRDLEQKSYAELYRIYSEYTGKCLGCDGPVSSSCFCAKPSKGG